MAEPARAEPEETETTSDQPSTSSKSTLVIRLAALLFLVAVILGECLVALRLLSPASAGSTAEANSTLSQAAAANEHGQEQAGPTDSEPRKTERAKKVTPLDPLDDGEPGDAVDQMEVDLGQFTVTTHQPAANTTMRIDFRLYGILARKNKEDFEKAMKAIQQRFREQVLVTVRSAEGPDLADAGLGLIKRQILEKTNALLGKPLLRAIIISDFSYMEQ